jgi:hypothetical protein
VVLNFFTVVLLLFLRLLRPSTDDRDKALFVSGLTGDPCDGLKYGKHPTNHRDPNVGDGTKCYVGETFP